MSDEQNGSSEVVIRAEDVRPRPASRRLVVSFLAAVFLLATVFGVIVTLTWVHSNDNARTLRNLQKHQTQVLCDAIVKSVRDARAKGTPDNPATVPFLKSFGCKVPSDF